MKRWQAVLGSHHHEESTNFICCSEFLTWLTPIVLLKGFLGKTGSPVVENEHESVTGIMEKEKTYRDRGNV